MKPTLMTCIQCDDVFEFTASEQEKYERLGFDAPRRCPKCRKNKFKSQPFPEPKRFKERKRSGRARHHENDFD